MTIVAFPTSAKGKKKRVDTIVLDQATIAKLKNPTFQRPFRMTPSVQAVVDEIRSTGIFPGILTVGVYDSHVWVIDGQHRLEAVRISERGDVLADVHYLDCDSEDEMAEEFRKTQHCSRQVRPRRFTPSARGIVTAATAHPYQVQVCRL